MRKVLIGSIVLLLFGLPFSLFAKTDKSAHNYFLKGHYNSFEIGMHEYTISAIDSTEILAFYGKYPKLVLYKNQVLELYKKHNYNYIWYDKKGKKEIADVLYNKINNLGEEGVQTTVPYKNELEDLFQKSDSDYNLEGELFLSSYYFYYTNKVIQGVDDSKVKEMEWYLQRKKLNYVDYVDSLLIDPNVFNKKEQQIDQYYKLKEVLQKYRTIEKNGGWKPIKVGPGFKEIKPGESSDIIAQIRTRLYLTGDIATDSKNKKYGKALQDAVLRYKKRNGFSANKVILKKHIEEMNIPVGERIKTIMVNMERCRWISTDVTKDKEYIVVNIPSYRLTYFKNGKVVLVSDVVVGDLMNKTVIFSGMMSYIVFCPYWNIPSSIIQKEIIPGMKKNKDYLNQKNMEWNGGNVRQKPGPNNSLGLVKFLFPNTNNIYLHDTPLKELFKEENRAFSHGCIRVAKPVELANLILENDSNWSPEKVQKAMNAGKESWYTLQNKIPVYIGYFTAWVNDGGTVNFYKDIYDRDDSLASMLIEE